jgi:hypothetical protein
MIARHCLALSLLVALGACGGEQRQWEFLLVDSAGVTTVTEGTPEPDVEWNATVGYGAFFVRDGCLQVQEGTRVWTPVLPLGTSISGDQQALIVRGRRFDMGRTYTLTYPGELPADVAGTIGLPNRCPQRLLRIRALH